MCQAAHARHRIRISRADNRTRQRRDENVKGLHAANAPVPERLCRLEDGLLAGRKEARNKNQRMSNLAVGIPLRPSGRVHGPSALTPLPTSAIFAALSFSNCDSTFSKPSWICDGGGGRQCRLR